jgi:predicted amidophosphoribosyltransferase
MRFPRWRWLTSRPTLRMCPTCGRDVKKGLTVCEACGHDFAKADSARPGPSEGR